MLNNPVSPPEMDGKKITEADVAENVTSLKEGQRLPTPEEMQKIKNFAIKYKNANPRASKRNIERAVMKKYNITLID